MSFAYGFGLPHWQPLSGAFSPLSLFSGGVQGAWYDPSDSTTLFSDRAGTTPCGTPGGGSVVPVGLMLDKSQGLVLGSELVTAPYSGTVSGGFSITSTSVVRDGVTAGGTASLTLSTTPTANAFYQVTFTAAGLSGDNTIIRVGSTASGNFYRITTAGTYTIYLPAGGTAAILGIAPFAGSAGGITLTNISVRALAGNHAIAANDTTARPELRARVNLLTYSEQFENAAWTKADATVTPNAAVAPDGTTTADELTNNTTTNFHGIEQSSITPTSASEQFDISWRVKKSSVRYIGIGWYRTGASTAGAGFDLDTGTVTGIGAAGGYSVISASISALGNGWFQCNVRVTGVALTQFPALYHRNTAYAGGAAFFGENYTGSTADKTLIWGADIRPTNIGTTIPAYQRISDANTYDAVGFPRYLVANGTSSAMSTPGNVNLSGTDKATVFAGVRKNSGTSGVISELSANVQVNNGAFVLASAFVSATTYDVQVRGTDRNARSYDTYTAPVSNVLSSEITTTAANSAAAMQTRVNGAVNAGSSFLSVTSTGNFGSYPLFIGSRNNASLFFNGNIYSLIVVGSAVSAGQISATEQWVAQRTGITI